MNHTRSSDGGGFPEPLDLRALEGGIPPVVQDEGLKVVEGRPFNWELRSGCAVMAEGFGSEEFATTLAAAPTLLALLREALGMVCHKGSCSSQATKAPLFAPGGAHVVCDCGLVDLLTQVTNWEEGK